MIQLIEAPPRSGKTYFAVNYLMKFVSYDELYGEFILKSDVLIISNIEGLKINHWKLSECLKGRTTEEFFSIENFERIMEKTGKRHVILVIDECHDLFPSGYYNQSVYSFFAYHGHIGLDIILMTQSLQATSRLFNPLLEFIVKVTPRSRAVLNNFSYSFVDLKGRFLYSRTLAKKPLVFKAYKSFRVDEKHKPKNAVKHWAILTLIIFIGAGFLFKTALGIVKGKSEEAKRKTEAAEQAKAVMKAPASSPASINPPVSYPPGGVTSPPLSPLDATPLPAPPVSSGSGLPSVSSGPGLSFPPAGEAVGMIVPTVAATDVRVAGVISDGKKRRYLLTDGRLIESQRKLIVGDAFGKR